MAWVRIDDQIGRHLKFLQVGPAASWLWVLGIAHCQSHLTDGFISDLVLPLLGVPKGYRMLVDRLVNVELFEKVEGGYRVHHYLDHNPSRDEVLRRRAEDLGRKRNGIRADSGRNSLGIYDDSNRPILSHPVPIPSEGEDHHKPTAKRPATSFEQFWDAYPRKVGKMAAWREWQRLKPDDALTTVILAAVAVQQHSREWQKDGGQFIPHPRTWLSQGRWEDQPVTALAVSSTPVLSKRTQGNLDAAARFIQRGKS